MKTLLATGLAVALALTLAEGAAAQQRAKLTIYTALENDQLVPIKQSIEKAVPEAEVVWVRDSTGVITARFLAEKDNPRADMVMGLAASSLLMFEKAGLLETYKPQGADGLKEIFRDAKERPTPGPAWTPSSGSSASTPRKPARSRSQPRLPGRTSSTRSSRAKS